MTESSLQENRPWYSNPLISLSIMFGIPALLVIGGFFFVALYGQIPGGTTTECRRTLTDAVAVRIEIYGYTAGLTYYERQTFFTSTDGGESWQAVFMDDVQAPRGVDCSENILVLADGSLILFSSKSVAIGTPDASEWRVHHVCDDPRPAEGRCDADPLNIVQVDFPDSVHGTVRIQEGIVDEYGQPLFLDGAPRIASEYHLQTSDGGQSWQLSN